MNAGAEKACSCDVLVIGGGPAGSTVSSRLSELGWDVVLIDKDRHPRFHIGESLLPRNLPIFERLGVLDEVKSMAVVKHGADIGPPDDDMYRRFTFAEANPALPTAFQVKRADFDAMLLQKSAARGTRVVQGTKATGASFAYDGAIVKTVDDAGAAAEWRASFVVDASGRDAMLANHLKMKVRDARHNSAAVFAHFSGVERRGGTDAGNTSIVWFDYGWFWTIPLPDGNDSVGVVCDADYLRTRKVPLEQFLLDTIAACPQLARRMEHATPVSEVHAAGNYSYKSAAMHGDRYLLVGDAYAFLDPMFSTGVYLAMESAMRGAAVVDRCLRDPGNTKSCLAEHARTMDRGLERLAWFIYRFNNPSMQNLFMASINPLNMRRDVISLLAGDVFQQKRSGIAVPAFKLAYYALNLVKGRSDRATRVRARA